MIPLATSGPIVIGVVVVGSLVVLALVLRGEK
jgi:hypothetical protein